MIASPILIPLLFAILSIFTWQRSKIQHILALVGTTLLLICSIYILQMVITQGIQVLQIGNWPAPFGISLVVDLFSAILLLVAAFISLVITIYARSGIDAPRIQYGFFPLFFFLMMGVNGAFITGDLFNLYVWFEVLLMASFVLIAYGGERPQIEGAIKYVILNLLASVLFLSAIGLIYNLTGTLNLADLAHVLPGVQPYGQVTVISVLFLIAFGIKSAVFPLFFWLPASYHTAPVAITALFSALLTKVGVYALIRVFTLLFTQDTAYTHTILLIIAGFTMVTGVLGAAAQTDFRRLLSFHIISQIGYLLMGLGLYSQESLAASIYFMVHIMLAKTALFLVAGMIGKLQGSYDLKILGGLYTNRIGLSLLFLLPAFSLAGLPPLSGFFAKLGLIIAGIRQQQGIIVIVALTVSLMTLYSMTKVWNEAFWKIPKPAQNIPTGNITAWMWVPTMALVIVSLLVGVFAEPILQLTQQAAIQLMNPDIYIKAVFGGLP